MSVSVDTVVSKILTSGEAVLVQQKTRIASNLGIPSHDSDQWETAHNSLVLESHELFSRILQSWVVHNGEEANIGRLTNIMKDMQLLAVADAISELGNPNNLIAVSSTQQPPIFPSSNVTNSNEKSFVFGVKQPIHDFVGRSRELKKVDNYFVDQRPKCVVIYAIGGQGKTELCKKFLHNLITANSSPLVVVWLPGESIQELTSRVSKLAHRLSMSKNDDGGKPLPLLHLLKAITKHIKNQFPNQRWLFVVDNVDEEYPELEQIIQMLIDFEAFVLITSRKNDILPRAPRTTSLQLRSLSSSDAMLLVRNSLPNASNEEDVTSLCDKVGGHALALKQSLAYIQSQTSSRGKAYGISYLLQEFQDCQKLILQHPVKLVDYNHTTHAIVCSALDSISTKYENIGQLALEMGMILGFVNPSGVHLDILQKLHNFYITNRPKPAKLPVPLWSRLLILRHLFGPTKRSRSALSTKRDTREAVLLLAKYSLVSLNDEVVSIHRLVQMVLRLECEYNQTVKILLKQLQPGNASVEELRQLISIWEHADHETVKIYPEFARQVFKRMNDLSVVLELSDFAEKNRTLFSQLLGPNHVETLRMEYCASLAMFQKGDYEASLTRLRILHEKQKEVFWEEHPSTLNTAALISTVLWHLKRNEEALEWRERELESTVKLLGKYHIDTMVSWGNKALILADLGRIDEGLSILQQVLEWRQVKLGASHPQTLSARSNIANSRFHQGHFHEARSEFETILKLKVEVLGEEHVDTLKTKSSLSRTNLELRRREDAIRMLEEVLVSREKVLGPSHPVTNDTRNILSTWIKYQRGDVPSVEVK